MDAGIQSMVRAAVQVELAVALGFAGAVRRYAEFTLEHGENFANTLLEIAREPDSIPRDRIVAEALDEYRDYVRELATLPSLAAMGFFEQLDRLRTPRPSAAERRGGNSV